MSTVTLAFIEDTTRFFRAKPVLVNTHYLENNTCYKKLNISKILKLELLFTLTSTQIFTYDIYRLFNYESLSKVCIKHQKMLFHQTHSNPTWIQSLWFLLFRPSDSMGGAYFPCWLRSQDGSPLPHTDITVQLNKATEFQSLRNDNTTKNTAREGGGGWVPGIETTPLQPCQSWIYFKTFSWHIQEDIQSREVVDSLLCDGDGYFALRDLDPLGVLRQTEFTSGVGRTLLAEIHLPVVFSSR